MFVDDDGRERLLHEIGVLRILNDMGGRGGERERGGALTMIHEGFAGRDINTSDCVFKKSEIEIPLLLRFWVSGDIIQRRHGSSDACYRSKLGNRIV